MTKKFIFISIWLLLGHMAISQNIEILDKSDLQPLQGVTITNISKTKTVITNMKGIADISIFTAADTLIFQHLAYQALKLSLTQIKKDNNRVLMTDQIIKLDEVVLSANKFEESKNDLPNKFEIISSKQIALNNPQTTADVLHNSGHIMVQQSQMGGGSPILRGFEANRVLMVVDGVRMNNAIYRSGHLQNIITLDPNILERVEISFGPGSVMYGSDAVGGVMHYYTKKPILSLNEKLYMSGSAFARYSSANSEMAGNFSLNFGFKKWGFLTVVSYKNLADLQEGKNRNPFYNDWGLRKWYVERIDGKDSVIANNDTLVQKGTGYSQYDVMQKILFRPNNKSSYLLNFQYSGSSDIPRYDRLTQVDSKTGLPAYAEWYYGPQIRILGSLTANYKNTKGLYDDASVILAWQNISEDRISRKFNNNSREYREETVNVISVNADFQKNFRKKNELRYGAEVLLNSVGSYAYAINVATGNKSENISSRYPDLGSTMNTYAAYLSHNWEIGKHFIFSQGIRYSYISLQSEYSDTMMRIMKFPFDNKISQQNSSLNGSIGLVYLPGYDWKISLLGSSGFRTPNVDDLTKVNDSKGKSRLLVVPNPDLEPERAYNADLTLSKTFRKKLMIELTGFYTYLTNAIVARPNKFNGQDSIMYDGYLCQVQANTNTNEAEVYGFQASLLSQVTPNFSISSSLNYTYGQVITDDVPMDHIPPVFGITRFIFEAKKFRSELNVRYCGWKRLERYSPAGEDNIDFATVNGLPSWYTINLKGSWQINKALSLQLGVENILDMHYRYIASGVSAPGRNIMVAIRGTF